MDDRKARKHRAVWVVGFVCVLGGLATAALAAGKTKSVVVPFQDAKFAAMDPSMPEGPQIAALEGNPMKGQSTILLKLKKGQAPLHTHSSDYHAVLIQGSSKHWDKGQEEKDAKVLVPGSYWFQPGKQVHGDACLSDECLLFVRWSGKIDFKLAEEPKKK